MVEGEPKQQISTEEESCFELEEHDLVEQEEGEQAVRRISEEEGKKGFDLERGPLIRGRLIRVREQEHVLLLTMHHIVSDAWSLGILRRELSVLYGAYTSGGEDPLPELEIQYADYAVWQRKWIEGEVLREQGEYWKRSLRGAPGLLELPTDHGRPAQQDYAGTYERVVLEEGLTERLRALSRRAGTTLYMTVLAGWAALLGRLSGETEVVIGTPTANRGRAEIENLIGFFVNTLALRIEVGGRQTVWELLEEVKKQALEAQRHQDIPFEQVVELVQPERSLSRSPIFQVMFAWQNREEGKLEFPGVQLGSVSWSGHRVAKFDITMSLQETGEKVVGGLEYATSLFEKATIQKYLGYWLKLLEGMVANEQEEVAQLSMLTKAEREQVLYGWNDTAVEYPREKCVHELFEEQAEKQPDAVAVVYGEESLSYGELNRRANRLAGYLRSLGVREETRVGICMERGLAMIESLLAVLKAGAGYVPLDPGYPQERLRYMLEDSGAEVLLTADNLREQFSGICAGIRVVDVKEEAEQWKSVVAGNLDKKSAGPMSRHLAYVIYTSGSTGQPKGVAIEHRSAVNLINWAQITFSKEVLGETLFSTSLNFDLSVYECFVPLSIGARVRIVANAVDWVGNRTGTTLINMVPSALDALLGTDGVPSTTKTINLAGEQLSSNLAEQIFRTTRADTVCNLYGPTETTTYSTWMSMKRGGNFQRHIGMPIGNTQVYILDGRGEPAPIGVAGEIYIGGAGVARGYQNRPDLTAERFVPNPFGSGAGERMYRTGDLGRWQRDGNIEFLGRNDDQVKVRGFRIELGEIEARLREHEAIREAVVAVREDEGGEKRLVAYYTSKQGEVTSAEQLREHLKKKVPEYMVPSAYVVLESLPLTANGKLDRKALPAPGVDAYDMMAYEEPQGKTEEELALIWQALLKVERVGRQDTFFALGGHSLLAVRMIMRVQQTLGVEVAIRDVFAHPVLCDFAGVLEKAVRVSLPSIGRVAKRVELPLSFAQQRLWFLAQMEGGSEAYHIALGLRLTGDLDAVALRRALDRIVGRHEALRTRFVMVEGEPKQQISTEEESCFELEEHDLVEQEEGEQAVRRISEEEGKKGFDLERGPLIRGRLIRVREQEHVLLLTMHHIVSDAWSLGILRRELSVLYGAYTSGGEDPLPELEIQYADYAVWQRKWIEGEVLREQGEYWKRSLRGAPGLLELPTDHGRPAQQDYAGTYERVVLEEGLTERLRALSRRAGTTLYMTVLAGWAALLGRLSGETEVVIGTPTANRGRAEIENLIGFFVNTLALRIEVGGRQTVWELLEEVKKQALEAQRHQDIPFEQVVELVQPERSLSRSPIFQVMFAWQNREEGKLEFPGVQLGSVSWSGHRVAKFDITMSLQETGEKVVGGLEYATSLFEKATIQKYLGYWLKLLEGMVANEQEEVAQLSMLTKAEREQVLYGWNDTAVEYPREKCVHELFEEQAEKQPDAVAVVYGEESLSYGELNRRANRLAGYLRSLGVREETRVGICMERGLAMIESLLAVLKAGAGYVPLDPGYPQERLRYMLEDSAPFAVLTQQHLRYLLGTTSRALVVEVTSGSEAWSEEAATNPGRVAVKISAADLAYVIYTSGSTGAPKGVMIPHGAVTNFLRSMQQSPGIKATDVLLSVTTVSFDIAGLEFYLPLSVGAQLRLVSREAGLEGAQLLQELQRGVTVMQGTPASWQLLLDAGWNGSEPLKVLCGGEALTLKLSKELLSRSDSIWNMYGPTETTIWSLVERLDTPQERITIGMPIGNTQVYILDGRGEPAPIGVAGEIYIGGAGVARGYQNRPDLTAERFVPNPFGSGAGERMYRTGDLGRWQRDGNIEFLGRNDDQVKVRGFRIELGEIEARLREHEAIREAVVAVREDEGGEKRLVAYYTSKQGEVTSAEQLREHLKKKVPEYMVPTIIMELEAMPLTANGKLDRKALPAPDLERMVEWRAPRTPEEEILCGLFAEVLGVERVGLDDNFFDLGGHSLMATRLVSRIRSTLSVQLSIRDLFLTPTVGRLGPALKQKASAEWSMIRKAASTDRVPLSFAQKRLWFVDKLGGGSTEYNMPFALILKGELDRTALERSIDTIVERHESLRTHFSEESGEPYQNVVEGLKHPIAFEDISGLAEGERRGYIRSLLREEAGNRFDLQTGPLFRVKLVRLGETEHVLLRTIHHIVFDGWSEAVFNRELMVLYNAFRQDHANPLKPLAVQYRDFSMWQKEKMSHGKLSDGLAYWVKQLDGIPQRLELPVDRPRPSMQTFSAERVYAKLDEPQLASLKRICRENHVTLYMVLLGAFGVLLSRYSGQEDIVVGSPIANRQDEQLESMIGFFVNSLALRIRASGKMSFRSLLEQVRQMSLEAYQYQDVPFERIVEELAPERTLDAPPIFQVMFALQNMPPVEQRLSSLELRSISSDQARVRFDLEVHAYEHEGQCDLYWLYNRDLFDSWRMQQMARHYVSIIDAVIKDLSVQVSRIPLLGQAEREQLLYGWNATEAAYPQDKCIHELFEEQARAHPDAVAVTFDDTELTYGELNARANRLAHHLRSLGVGPDARVGLCVERSLEMVIGLLGILKAGGAYVPLDPAYPQDRLRFMLQDAVPMVLLTQTHLRNLFAEMAQDLVVLDLQEPVWLEASTGDQDLRGVGLRPDHLAYIIYTSGSTGMPKGVMIEHRNVVRLFAATDSWFHFSSTDIWSLFHSYAFDFSVWEIWGALLYGGRLIVVPIELARSPEELYSLLCARKVTVLNQTPSSFRQIMEAQKNEATENCLRLVIFGGEALEPSLLKSWYERNGEGKPELINMYGITETTVHVTYRPITRADTNKSGTSPIGRPIPDMRAYILDGEGELVPVGVVGQLYIGGAGVARGYLNRPELTSERFVRDPFSPDVEARMYSTGDLGRWLSDGNIEFFGRSDFQVKIRGFRIELGEIEAALSKNPSVQDAVVIVNGTEDHKSLTAYITLNNDSRNQVSEEKEYLSHWKDIYETTYREGASSVGDFNLSGWKSSYTGEQISIGEMQLWLDETLSQIRALKPRKVLEIGCGTGLILTRIAPHCEQYIGIDYSSETIQQLRGYVPTRADLTHVELHEGRANELDFIEDRSVDLIILNSIIQYFPSGEYLKEVLRQALRKVKEDGAIFIGDIRNLQMQEIYHASIQLHHLDRIAEDEVLATRIARGSRYEKELLIDPALFREIAASWSDVASASIRAKCAPYDNELSRFRYDVVLRTGSKLRMLSPLEQVQWSNDGAWVDILEQTLLSKPDASVSLLGFRDARTSWLFAAMEMIKARAWNRRSAEISELRKELSASEPSLIADLCQKLGVDCEWSDTWQGRSNIVFRPRWENANQVKLHEINFERYTNNPSQNLVGTGIIFALKEDLKTILPEYMVPSAYVVLESLPLTANGKLDRKALPAPDLERMVEWRAPRTPEEEILCGLFAEVLGVERVGLDDNFFDLGGHSLMATRLVSRIRSTLSVQLSIRDLFLTPTVGRLGPALKQKASAEWSMIRKAASTDRVPLSFAQKRLWFVDKLGGGSTEYNMPFALILKGELDRTALERSIDTIVERHESLRTHFSEESGEPYQNVVEGLKHPIAFEDISGLAEGERRGYIRSLLREEAGNRFDLQTGPLFRVKLVRLGETEHVLLRTIHHIVFDGWSEAVFNRELMVLYNAFRQDHANPLKPLAVQYRDFSMWQKEKMSHGKLSDGLAYWVKQLDGIPQRLELPVDRPRPSMQTFSAERVYAKLDEPQLASLKRICRENHVTLYMVLLGAFGVLLSRYSGQEDIVVGSPIANRQDEQLESMIGFFVNSLALRIRASGKMSFRSLLEQVRQMSLEAYQYQDVPFERIVEELAPERTLDAPPIFQVMFALQNMPPVEQRLSSLELRSISSDQARVRFDLEVHAYEHEGQCDLYWLYNRDLFDSWRMQQMARHYVSIIDAVIKDLSVQVSRIPLLGQAEREQLLYGWNATEAAYPQDKCIHELFEEQARAHPDAVAVTFDDTELTYGELNARANRLAHHLRSLGVGPDARVGLCVERSLEMVIGLLGILKAGGAYVPLDPAYPQDRLRFMLQDAVPMVLLTQTHLRNLFAEMAQDLVVLDLQEPVWLEASTGDQDLRGVGLRPDHLAYIIYTSGSTGMPKGVMIEHRNTLNLIAWASGDVSAEELRCTLASTSLSFDLAVYEIFLPLSCGATIRIVRNVLELTTIVNDVSLINTVPSAIDSLIRSGNVSSSIRRINLAGEPLLASLVRRIFASSEASKVSNLYGPSETTTYSTWTCIERSRPDRSHIGRPIWNTQIYILDGEGEPVPVGVVGQLYIAGAGVARGYLNRPELTSERFVRNPFSPDVKARMYSTGDLGRWLSDGNIEFLGRSDFQVKIRGFRIELGEIEAALRKNSSVQDAVVLAREAADGDKRLIAYYIGGGTSIPHEEQLREHMSSLLPAYMVPSAYVLLESLPLTPNGKVDRKALPTSNIEAYAQRGYEAPKGEIERTLAAIWAELLGLETVDRSNNFFSLGGHSLLAVRMITRLRRLGLELSLSDLFKQPVLSRLSQKVVRPGHELSLQSPALIQDGDGTHPLFIILPSADLLPSAFIFASGLDDHSAVYCLIVNEKGSASFRTVQGVASKLVQQICATQSMGAYRLIGFVDAGCIAYEVAAQLLGADSDVAFLGIVENIESPLMSYEATNVRSRSFEDGTGEFRGDIEEAIETYHPYPISITLAIARKHHISKDGQPRWWQRIPAMNRTEITVSEEVNDDGEYLAAASRELHLKTPGFDNEPQVDLELDESPLFLLRDARDQASPEIFCIPGAGGNVTAFTDLAAILPRNSKVYGFQPKGVDGNSIPHSTVESAALEYVKEIRSPATIPISLVGHSFGGWVAYEVALQLLDNGRTCDSLVIIDSEAPENTSSSLREYSQREVWTFFIDLLEQLLGRSMKIDIKELLLHEETERYAVLHERMVVARLVSARSSPSDLRGPVRAFASSIRTRYVPKSVFTGRVHLILADDERRTTKENQIQRERTLARWLHWAPNLTWWRAPGNHMTMLKAPNVDHIGEHLKDLHLLAF